MVSSAQRHPFLFNLNSLKSAPELSCLRPTNRESRRRWRVPTVFLAAAPR